MTRVGKSRPLYARCRYVTLSPAPPAQPLARPAGRGTAGREGRKERGREAAAAMEEPLCCCEYVDRRGRRNHLAACCCDCRELDEGCDRITSEKRPLGPPTTTLDRWGPLREATVEAPSEKRPLGPPPPPPPHSDR
ncbi:Intraflagellar transport protein 25-like protein [Aix galericulata]|nr:Intraflagellar transport protein 25-like protein [Aix galericulata]